MSASLDQAEEKLRKADRYLKWSIIVFIAFLIAVMIRVSYQLYDVQQGITAQQIRSERVAEADRKEAQRRLELALKENADQHRKTQAYVKCVANVLLTPLSQRSSSMLDECGIEVTTTGTAPQNEPQQQSRPQPARTQARTTAPAKQPPTNSAPPEPNRSRQEAQNNPFLDSILEAIGVRKINV